MPDSADIGKQEAPAPRRRPGLATLFHGGPKGPRGSLVRRARALNGLNLDNGLSGLSRRVLMTMGDGNRGPDEADGECNRCKCTKHCVSPRFQV